VPRRKQIDEFRGLPILIQLRHEGFLAPQQGGHVGTEATLHSGCEFNAVRAGAHASRVRTGTGLNPVAARRSRSERALGTRSLQSGTTILVCLLTPAELSAVVRRALAGTGAKFSHSVAPLFARQIVDISYVG
jgi:hypothetical protein